MDPFGKKILLKHTKEIIIRAGLDWEVVESVPIHEDIKRRVGSFKQYIENYKKTIENLRNVVFIIFATILCQF